MVHCVSAYRSGYASFANYLRTMKRRRSGHATVRPAFDRTVSSVSLCHSERYHAACRKRNSCHGLHSCSRPVCVPQKAAPCSGHSDGKGEDSAGYRPVRFACVMSDYRAVLSFPCFLPREAQFHRLTGNSHHHSDATGTGLVRRKLQAPEFVGPP